MTEQGPFQIEVTRGRADLGGIGELGEGSPHGGIFQFHVRFVREALEFLGNLLLAQANDERSCQKSIEPNGAGSALFSETSNN